MKIIEKKMIEEIFEQEWKKGEIAKSSYYDGIQVTDEGIFFDEILSLKEKNEVLKLFKSDYKFIKDNVEYFRQVNENDYLALRSGKFVLNHSQLIICRLYEFLSTGLTKGYGSLQGQSIKLFTLIDNK
jgi:hypothetical protein